MRVYVVRHGETSWNVQRRFQGHQGSDLNEAGVLLAQMTAEGLRDVPFDVCYTSPLARARHTAEILLRGRDVPVVEDERLKEIGFGVWEGLSCDLNHLEVPREQYEMFHRTPYDFVPPRGGERVQDVLERTKSFWLELVGNPALQTKRVLIATHGCAMRALLHNVYEDHSDFWQGGVPMNCAVSIVEVKDGAAKLCASDQVYYGPEYYRSYYKLPDDSQ